MTSFLFFFLVYLHVFLLFLQQSSAVAMGSLSAFAVRPAPEPIHVSEGTFCFFGKYLLFTFLFCL